MKKVTFKGQVFEVPAWAEYIADDYDGEVFVFEKEPELYRGVWKVGGEFLCVSGARKPECMKIN